jgi:hypothetical protein
MTMRKKIRIKRTLITLLCSVLIIGNLNLNAIVAQATDRKTVDITGLATGAETSHDCNKYLTSKYNTSQHWQECTVCGKLIGSKTNHSFATTGTAGCNLGLGYQYRQCSCGYSYRLDKTPHSSNGSWIACGDRHGHYQYCTECHVWSQYGYCVNASGQRLGCSTGVSGTCAVCHTYRDASKHAVIVCSQTRYQVSGTTISTGGNLVCQDCYATLGQYSITTYKISANQSKAVLDASTYFNIPSITMGAGNCNNIAQNGVTFQVTSLSQSGNNIHSEAVVNYNSSILAPAEYEIHLSTGGFSNSSFVGGWTYIHMNGAFRSDWDAPSYTSSNVNYYSYVSGYATRATITAQYYEGYSGECYIRLLDSDGTTVLSNWKSATKVGSYFSTNIDITDEITGSKTIYLQAKDTIGNTSGLTAITVSNLDSKAPTQTSSLETATNWSKSKDMTISSKDVGSGKVQIGFNNTSGYALATANGTSYSRDYTFTGDVYGNVTAAVYLKDAVGNETTSFIKIYNLDNTAPTITNMGGKSVADEKVRFTVTANDNKDFGGTVGVKAGSGVSSYAISSSNTAPAGGWQNSNEVDTTEDGIHYIFAKDAVGNVSSPYEVKVITLTINFNGGKYYDSTSSKKLLGTICGSKTTNTFDIKQYYGSFKGTTYNSKGLNTKLTKTVNDQQYRFLGYSLNPNATVPDSNFDVYNIKERTENYTIRDNTTLYAVWEPVLQMTVQLSAPQHSGVMQLTSDVPVTTTLGNFKISSGTRSTEIPSSATASVNSATIGTNVTNKDLVTYTVSAKGASNIKFSTAADSRILDIYTHGNNNTWFDKLNTTDKFEYTIDNFSNTTSSFTIPQYIGTKKSYKTSNPESATGTSVYAIKFTCTQPSYYYSKYWNSPESTSVYGILFLNPTLPDDNTNGGIILPPSAVEDGAYEFETILN